MKQSKPDEHVVFGEKSLLPNFFIVGVAKAGTTSLYEWLRQHPQVFLSPIKEPHYFSHDLFETPRFVVEDHAQYLALFNKAASYPAVGEASASYFPGGDIVAKRIKALIPSARIIIILRDPIERAYSDYLMYVRQGIEDGTIFEALAGRYASTYVQTYTKPVVAYLEAFGKDKVLILLFEDLKRDPRKLLATVFHFLNIDETAAEGIKLTAENQSGLPQNALTAGLLGLRRRLQVRSLPLPAPVKKSLHGAFFAAKPALDPAVVDYMRPFFEDDIRALEKLLRRPLPELRNSW